MSFSLLTTFFASEQGPVLIIILTLIILAAALYASTVHTLKQQESFIAKLPKPIPSTPTTTAAPAPKQAASPVPPAALTMQQQQEEREEYMRGVQNSLEKRFHDVDTYFATKQPLENRQLRAQQAAERQRYYAREDFLDWARELQAIRTLPMPRVIQPPAPPIVERIPFIPGPGSWDPLVEQQMVPGQFQGGAYQGGGYQDQGYQGQGIIGGYQMGWTGEGSGYAPWSMVAPMVDRWLDGVSLAGGSDDTHLTRGSFVHGSQGHPNSPSNSDNGSTISINSRMTHISI